MISLNRYTVAVETEDELRDAVGDSECDYIYLANSMTLAGGITIPPGKESLVLDGEYPPNSGVRNTFTDMDSDLSSNTIGVRDTSDITITVKNMVISGHNYYGVPYIAENLWPRDTSGVSVIYENVSYTGPQMTYNCNGFTRYQDCDITITQTSGTLPQEVGEINRVELGGRTAIYHTSSQNDRAVFYFRGDAETMSLTVLTGAKVTVESVNSYFMYNMLPVFLTPYPVPYVIQPAAELTLKVNRGLSYESHNQIASFLVDEGASFQYIQTASNGTAASLYLNGALTVKAGAVFHMQAANGTEPLIHFTSGSNRSFQVDNPLRFALYCANDAALVSAGTTQFSLRGGQLNAWNNAKTPVESAGRLDDIPDFKWFKEKYEVPLVVTGSFTGTATTVAAHNLEPAEQLQPISSNLHLHTARVLSAGDWPVVVNPVVDDGSPITGQTEPNANLRVEYDVESAAHSLSGTAGSDGAFVIDTAQEVPPQIPAGTGLAIGANIPFLIKDITAEAVEAGELLIASAPAQLVYAPEPVATNPVLLPRADPAAPVVVEDTRVYKTRWRLSASITGPLQTESGDVLPDAMVFLDSAGAEPVSLTQTPVTVYLDESAQASTNVFWPEDAGILIRVTEPMRTGIRYTTTVEWTLRAENGL